MTDQEKQAAEQLTALLKQVAPILETLPPDSWLRQMDATIATVLEVLKNGPGGGLPRPC